MSLEGWKELKTKRRNEDGYNLHNISELKIIKVGNKKSTYIFITHKYMLDERVQK